MTRRWGSCIWCRHPPVSTRRQAAIRFPGAPIGAFNEQVYGEWLGYDTATLDELRASKVI